MCPQLCAHNYGLNNVLKQYVGCDKTNFCIPT